MKVDAVNPAHYKGDYVMRIIEDFELDFCCGNVVKYICRHGKKAGIEDLKKAKWYLERAIGNLEKLNGVITLIEKEQYDKPRRGRRRGK